MNRLIIIGNGFDLAHDFKTSYQDFIFNYLKKSILDCDYFEPYLDDLIEIRFDKDIKFNKIDLEEILSFKDLIVFIEINRIKLTPKLYLFSKIYTLSIKNWVDIEQEFYNELVRSYRSYISAQGSERDKIKIIDNLNLGTDIIKECLIDYLKQVNKNIGKINTVDKFSDHFREIVFEDIKYDELLTQHTEDYKLSNVKPNSFLFLDFNYTNTLKYYLNETFGGNITHIKIHGELSDLNNPAIFGYGDEFHQTYKDIEELNNNSFLKHMKSFMYSQTSNYHNLIKFINQDDYQVYVIGHSCGLSDRMMLNRILDNDRCKSVKLFYHQIDKNENDFKTKLMDISRHFKNKEAMREKIVPFDKSRPFSIRNN